MLTMLVIILPPVINNFPIREQVCAKKSQPEGRWPDTIVVRQREIPGVWDSHNASGEKTVVVACRNATAEIGVSLDIGNYCTLR